MKKIKPWDTSEAEMCLLLMPNRVRQVNRRGLIFPSTDFHFLYFSEILNSSPIIHFSRNLNAGIVCRLALLDAMLVFLWHLILPLKLWFITFYELINRENIKRNTTFHGKLWGQYCFCSSTKLMRSVNMIRFDTQIDENDTKN